MFRRLCLVFSFLFVQACGINLCTSSSQCDVGETCEILVNASVGICQPGIIVDPPPEPRVVCFEDSDCSVGYCFKPEPIEVCDSDGGTATGSCWTETICLSPCEGSDDLCPAVCAPGYCVVESL